MAKEEPPTGQTVSVDTIWLRKWVVGEGSAWYGSAERQSWILDILNGLLRGPSQVCFMNNPLAGIASLIAIMAPSSLSYQLYVAVALATECLFAAILGRGSKSSRGAIRTGLFGYDGVLVGAACATFLDTSSHGLNMIVVLLAAAGAAVIKSALGAAWAPHGLPTFTMGFNLSTLLLLMAIQGSWKAVPAAGPPGPHLFILVPGVGVGSGAFSNSTASVLPAPSPWAGIDCLPSTSASPAAIPSGPPTTDCASVIIRAWFRGVAQVYFCSAWGSGLALAFAFALCSPVAALMAVLSSAIGFCTGLLFGAPPAELLEGLWGYNGVIAGIAISVFYRWEWRTAVAAGGCVVLCTLLQGALRTAFAPLAMPVLTLPFCTGAIIWLLAGWPLRVPLADATTPEAHALPRFGLDCGRNRPGPEDAAAGPAGAAVAGAGVGMAAHSPSAEPQNVASSTSSSLAGAAGVRLELVAVGNPAAAAGSFSSSSSAASSTQSRSAASGGTDVPYASASSSAHTAAASGVVAGASLLQETGSPAAEP